MNQLRSVPSSKKPHPHMKIHPRSRSSGPSQVTMHHLHSRQAATLQPAEPPSSPKKQRLSRQCSTLCGDASSTAEKAAACDTSRLYTLRGPDKRGLPRPSWGYLGLLWGPLVALLDRLGALLGRLDAVLGPPRPSGEALGALLGHLGALLDYPGPLLSLLGWGPLGAVLGHLAGS